jgi:hypothetical protein
MESISKDPRHHNLATLLSHEASERDFGEWSMAFRTFDDPSVAKPEGLQEIFTLRPDPVAAASRAHRLLALFGSNAR